MANTEGLHVAIKIIRAGLGGYPGQADIQGVLQAAGHVLRTPGAQVPVIDPGAANLDRAGIHKDGLGRNRAGIQRSRHRQHFVDRAGLVSLADRPVEGRVLGVNLAIAPELIQIHARHGRHRQHLAGLGAHDHDGAGGSPAFGNGRIDQLFHGALDLPINGQHQAGAIGDIGDLLHPVRIQRHQHGLGFARQQIVEALLDAKVTLVFTADKPRMFEARVFSG